MLHARIEIAGKSTGRNDIKAHLEHRARWQGVAHHHKMSSSGVLIAKERM